MELREYFEIFKKQWRIGAFFLSLFLVLGVVVYFVQPDFQKSILTLNITRTGTQDSTNYSYDEFYRLQADEKFGDTVVKWLGAPRMVVDILTDAGVSVSEMGERRLNLFFNAKRISPQTVNVFYYSTNKEVAEKISKSLVSNINKETEKLNEKQKNPRWFLILGDDPVILSGKLGLVTILMIALGMGIFFGVFSMLIRNYFESNEENRN